MDAHEISAWFDAFDWVLTPEEYVASGVGVLEGTKIIDGFVVASGREDLAWVRRRKVQWAWRKYKKARWWVRVLARVPFVRMIAIGNALGYGNCRDESDIDLVIITAPRRVWLVRFFIVGLLRFFRQRPGEHARLSFSGENFGEHGRDALCPSFFFTTEALGLEKLQLSERRGGATPCPSEALREGGSPPERAIAGDLRDSSPRLGTCSGSPLRPPDPYLLFWITQLTILYDAGGVYEAFWKANEAWVHQWLPHAQPRGVHPRFVICHCEEHERRSNPGGVAAGIAAFAFGSLAMTTRFGDAFERWARRFQERRFSSEAREIANVDSCVVANDWIIKLHTNDRRAEYRDQWLEALRT